MNHPLPRHRTRRGSTLVLAMFVIVTVSALLGIALEYTSRTGVLSRRGRDVVPAQALADGALEVAYKRWKTWMIQKGNTATPSATDLNVGGTCILNPTDILTRLNAVPGHEGYTVRGVRVVPVDREDNEITEHPVSAANINRMKATVPVEGHAGWSGKAVSYRAQAVVTCDNLPDVTGTGFDPGDGGGRRLTVTVSRFFQKSDSSLFQAMLFFQNDLELHPGPDMTLYGLIHTNSNLFAAAGTSGSVKFSSNVSYSGDATNPVLADPLNPVTRPGTASLTTTNVTSGLTEANHIDARGYVDGITKTLATQESGSWGGGYKQAEYVDRSNQLSNVSPMDPLGTATESAVHAADVNDNTLGGLHEIIERPVPASATNPNPNAAVPDREAYANRRVYNYAGLRILLNRNAPVGTNKVRVYKPDVSDPLWSDKGSTPKSVEIVPSTNPLTPNIANQILDAVTASAGTAQPNGTGTGDIKDFRENRQVNVSNVDVQKLTPALNAYTEYNGILYIADITNANPLGESSNVDAIRLRKGGVLPDDGMTVVTDGAIYVQGDFNSGATYGPDGPGGKSILATSPVSNANTDPTQYTVAGYTQKPSAVIGDAVMILSNNWSDDNGKNSDMGSRIAVPTTFNAAILSGAVPTTATAASGGAHNFPRFLEDWSNKNFTYYGSMVQLYTSQHWKGNYGTSNVYSPPRRRWFFDNTFLTSAPPGGCLATSTYSRGRWVRY